MNRMWACPSREIVSFTGVFAQHAVGLLAGAPVAGDDMTEAGQSGFGRDSRKALAARSR